jgi:hypothetical protein
LFLFTVVYIYTLSLLGQINYQEDNGIALDVTCIFFIDNEVVDGELPFWRAMSTRVFETLVTHPLEVYSSYD